MEKSAHQKKKEEEKEIEFIIIIFYRPMSPNGNIDFKSIKIKLLITWTKKNKKKTVNRKKI